jgi:hypothetical protein
MRKIKTVKTATCILAVWQYQALHINTGPERSRIYRGPETPTVTAVGADGHLKWKAGRILRLQNKAHK